MLTDTHAYNRASVFVGVCVYLSDCHLFFFCSAKRYAQTLMMEVIFYSIRICDVASSMGSRVVSSISN